MALRKGWAELSAPQRRRYERAGITAESYAAGANLEAARRGVNVTPPGGGREAARLKAKRATLTPARKQQIREREKAQRQVRVSDRRALADDLRRWSDEHARTDATRFRPPGVRGRVTNRDLERKEVIQYLRDYRDLSEELAKGWFGTRTRTGGDADVIDNYFRKYAQALPDSSGERYLRALEPYEDDLTYVKGET